MTRVPLGLAAIAAMAAVLLERLDSTAAVCAGVTLAVVSVSFVRRSDDKQARLAVLAGAVAFAAALVDATWRGHPTVLEREARVASWGTVIGDVRPDARGRTQTVVALDGGPTLRVAVDAPLTAGERIEIRGRAIPIDAPRNPGEPSMRELAADEGIAGEMVRAHILARASPAWDDLRTWMPRARAWASSGLRRYLPPTDAAIVAGALWGEKSALEPEVRAEFQTTGTVHVLVTAGLHLGVIATLALALCSGLRIPRAPAAVCSIAVVWLYVWFSGAHLPSLRAATMATVFLTARAIGARAFSANVYAAAVIAVALGWPASVGSASFWLSFSCVGAILLLATPLAAALERARVPKLPAEALALSIATQIGVWPLGAFVFLFVSPYAPLANVGVVPVVGVAMLLGIGTIVAAPLPALAAGFAHVDAWVLAWVMLVVRTVAHLPFARVDVVPPAPWQIVSYDVAIVAGALLARRRLFLSAAVAASCAIVAIAIPHAPPRGVLRIVALDVGQADAIVIVTPRGHAFMIDAGGKLERGVTEDGGSPAEAIGERVVVPYLLRSGITHLDGIILTHPHGDHVGGCGPILRHFHVAWIADSGQIYPGHAYQDCLQEAARRSIPIREPRAGEMWHTDDGVTIRFLAPSSHYNTGRNAVNENSIVVMLEYRDFRGLFMGDAGAQTEERLLAHGWNLHAGFLKVGHHGSAYSSTPRFIAAVSPAIAVISVGRHNVFGHPAPVTLQTMKAAGANVYRTDTCGAVSVTVTDRMEPAPFLGPSCLDVTPISAVSRYVRSAVSTR